MAKETDDDVDTENDESPDDGDLWGTLTWPNDPAASEPDHDVEITPDSGTRSAVSPELRQLLDKELSDEAADLIEKVIVALKELRTAQDALEMQAHDKEAAQATALHYGPGVISTARGLLCRTDNPEYDYEVEDRLNKIEQSLKAVSESGERTSEEELQEVIRSVVHVAIATCIAAAVAGPVVAWLLNDPLSEGIIKAGITAFITQSAAEIEKAVTTSRANRANENSRLLSDDEIAEAYLGGRSDAPTIGSSRRPVPDRLPRPRAQMHEIRED